MKKKIQRKGLTLVEVIVAMALVVIISLAGFSVINFSIKSSNKSYVHNFFMVEVQNYINAIMSGSDNYSNSISLLTGETLNYGDNAVIYYSSGLAITQEKNSKYHINIKFDNSPYSVICYDNQNNLIFKAEV
ncbi:MAG TPA: hypothetical protein DCO89_03195 [Clostridiales bacterium]|nr:hypothetical protein [Clostridiales bacterium]